VLSYQVIVIIGRFPFFTRTPDGFREFCLIFCAIDLRHHLDGEHQPDSVASLMNTLKLLVSGPSSAVIVNIVTAT
jgi:hypothetical protein